MSATRSLGNLQQELLKIYSSNVSDVDLVHLKDYLARYFAGKAISEADSIWDQKGNTEELMNQWLKEDQSGYGKESSD